MKQDLFDRNSKYEAQKEESVRMRKRLQWLERKEEEEIWLGEGEEADEYLKKALDPSNERQVMHYQRVSVFHWNHSFAIQIPLRQQKG